MNKCDASLVSASGKPHACLVGANHAGSHLAIDSEGNLLGWVPDRYDELHETSETGPGAPIGSPLGAMQDASLAKIWGDEA